MFSIPLASYPLVNRAYTNFRSWSFASFYKLNLLTRDDEFICHWKMHLQDELTGCATLKTVLTRYVQCVLPVNELPG